VKSQTRHKRLTAQSAMIGTAAFKGNSSGKLDL
jgi:hypothetical protein